MILSKEARTLQSRDMSLPINAHGGHCVETNAYPTFQASSTIKQHVDIISVAI
jgi:hypothetical protein